MKSRKEIRFDENGLVPAVVQDVDGGTVLMVGYMNAESLDRTLRTGEVHFFSRKRARLWKKGESSGNVLKLRAIAADCDDDCLLVVAEPSGPVCHTGERSCFFAPLESVSLPTSLGDALGRLSRTIRERDDARPEGSYTTKLLSEGVERIAQKVGEEATEVVIAATKENEQSLAEESADLLYHLLVIWRAAGIEPERVARVLEERRSAR